MNPPFYYDYANVCTSALSPSEIHVHNTGLARFFRRYLLQRAMSVFKWKLPKEWDENYFRYVLYSYGYITALKTKRWGLICQDGTLTGYNVYYAPTQVLISNPLLRGINKVTIGVNCEVVKLQPDWGGVLDLVSHYANLMAIGFDTAAVNTLNSKLSYVIGTDDKGAAETFKKMSDRVLSGEPAVAVGKNMWTTNGDPAWTMFTQNVGQNFIAPEVMSYIKTVRGWFDTEIGIPNDTSDKKERKITDEVNANNVETSCLADMWLESLKSGCEKVNKMFGSNLSVEWRYDPDESMSINSGVVELGSKDSGRSTASRRD